MVTSLLQKAQRSRGATSQAKTKVGLSAKMIAAATPIAPRARRSKSNAAEQVNGPSAEMSAPTVQLKAAQIAAKKANQIGVQVTGPIGRRVIDQTEVLATDQAAVVAANPRAPLVVNQAATERAVADQTAASAANQPVQNRVAAAGRVATDQLVANHRAAGQNGAAATHP